VPVDVDIRGALDAKNDKGRSKYDARGEQRRFQHATTIAIWWWATQPRNSVLASRVITHAFSLREITARTRQRDCISIRANPVFTELVSPGDTGDCPSLIHYFAGRRLQHKAGIGDVKILRAARSWYEYEVNQVSIIRQILIQ
jgi:hypothetical protein